MTLKEARIARRRRPRFLHNGMTFVPAEQVIRKRLTVHTIISYPFCSGKKECERRRKHL